MFRQDEKAVVQITLTTGEAFALAKLVKHFANDPEDVKNLWWRRPLQGECNVSGYPDRVVDRKMTQITHDACRKVSDALEQAKELDPDGARQYKDSGF